MAALKAFCIACARHPEGDELGKLLAMACTAPYFAVYHLTVLVHARRELHLALALVGLLLNAGLSTALKKALQQPRPAATCTLLGNCHKHGMPSSHAQVMGFVLATCLLLRRHRWRLQRQLKAPAGSSSSSDKSSSRLARTVEQLELLLLAALAAAVYYGRVYLGYHTPAQVGAGAALGVAAAAGWWQITLQLSRRGLFARLLQLQPLRGLHLRDTLWCPDVHAAEAEMAIAIPTGATSRKED